MEQNADANKVVEDINAQVQENSDLKEKYDTLHRNYDILQSNYDSMVRRLSKFESQMHALPSTNDKISMSKDITDMKGDALNATTSISELQNVWSYVDDKLEHLSNRLDSIDQYLKRDNLLIKGLKDVPKKCFGLAFSSYVMEKLKDLLPSIADQLKEEDISVSHPLPTKDKSKSIVIAKFVRRDIKNLIFFSKRELKNHPSKVSITEHLSAKNLWLMDEAKKLVGYKNVWSSQCTVFALAAGKKNPIKNSNDLDFIYKTLNKKYAPPSFAGVLTDSPNTKGTSTTPLVNNGQNSSVFSDPRNSKTTNSIIDTLANPDSFGTKESIANKGS